MSWFAELSSQRETQQMPIRLRKLLKPMFHCMLFAVGLSIVFQLPKLWHHRVSTDSGQKILAASLITNPTTIPQTVPFLPTDDSRGPKMLVILTYQRSGSTFFGRLFSQNPDLFYMFEPLDSLYSSLYGTPMSWNVPSDITSYKNGSHRFLPETEVKGVVEFLSSLLSCDVKSLPAETLVNPYLYYYKRDQYLAAGKYTDCIAEFESISSQCSSFAPRDICGGRFGEVSEDQLRDCRATLHKEEYRRKHKHKDVFEKYVSCMGGIKSAVGRNCSGLLESACRKAQWKVAKLVRATMDSMGPLLEKFANFRIVHLLRDPRAVVRSRKEFHASVRGLYSDLVVNHTLAREAKLFCRSVARDVRLRMELERKYPGKIHTVLYDDMVKDFKRHATDVYKFLGLNDPTKSNWYREAFVATTETESIDRANQWALMLSFNEAKSIAKECVEFFRLVDYTWL